MSVRPLVPLLTIACCLAGCPRAVRPGLGVDRTVTTGVELRVGSSDPQAPELTFDFGDGSPRIAGREARHAYARAGSYPVLALRGQQVVSTVRLTVVPRPLLAAVPPEASSVLFLPKVAGHLEAAIDFLEKLLGAEAVQSFLDEAVLPALAIELPSSDGPTVDPQEGLGLFTLPQLEGAVALIGVVDGDKAQEALIRQLVRRGGHPLSEADGTVRVRMPTGRELALFVDRGYLFVVVPELEELEPTDPDDPPPDGVRSGAGPGPALAAVRQAPDDGLGGAEAIARARALLPAADAYAYLTTPPSPKRAVDGLFAAFTFAERSLELDGIIQARKPLWGAGAAPVSPLLKAAPEGAIAAVSASAPPAELAAVFAGEPGTPRRLAAARRAQQGGVDLEALLSALAGDLAALVYFDAEGFLANLAAGSQKPEPRGTLLLQAGLSDLAPAQQWVEHQLSSAAIRHERLEEAEHTFYRARLRGQPIELKLGQTSASLAAGADARGPVVNLATSLEGRFGGAFGPGRLSAMIDLGRLRKQLAEPRTLEGVDPRRLVMVQGFASAFIEQLTPIDHAFVDLRPDPAGGRLRGRLVLRGK